jgi:23S rRNA pseudouridine1911/1915/1917 synthase
MIQKNDASLVYNGIGERIDTRLTTQFPYARNFFHHIISRGGVLVNNHPIKKSYKLKNGDTIMIDDISRFLWSEILAEAPSIQLPIVREKDDYLVLYKPKWVLSHPNSVRDVWQPSVVGFLYHHYKDLPTIGNFIRAWLLHRLDKATDGLMIVAKTEKWLAYFKALFQQKSNASTTAEKEAVLLHKYYRAVSHITPQGQEFLDSIAHFPHYITALVIAKVPHTTPKMGITKILSIQKHNDNKIILDIEILTGRTHQIRYHLSSHGLPIVDDYLYGKDEWWQMQLSAYMLTFVDCDGNDVKCVMP